MILLSLKCLNKTSMAKKELQALVAEQKILDKIHVIRGEKVILDRDLAEMYGVETRVLNQSIKKESEPVSQRLYVPVVRKGVQKLDITKCDIKLGRDKEITLCFYRTGSSYVIQCTQ